MGVSLSSTLLEKKCRYGENKQKYHQTGNRFAQNKKYSWWMETVQCQQIAPGTLFRHQWSQQSEKSNTCNAAPTPKHLQLRKNWTNCQIFEWKFAPWIGFRKYNSPGFRCFVGILKKSEFQAGKKSDYLGRLREFSETQPSNSTFKQNIFINFINSGQSFQKHHRAGLQIGFFLTFFQGSSEITSFIINRLDRGWRLQAPAHDEGESGAGLVEVEGVRRVPRADSCGDQNLSKKFWSRWGEWKWVSEVPFDCGRHHEKLFLFKPYHYR